MISLAGESGLPVAVAAALASSCSSPRPALVNWLSASLRTSKLGFTLQPSSAEHGGWIAVASADLRLRALGHTTLEHPVLAEPSSRALAVLGTAGRGGTLQTELADLLGLSFSTAHHYLLALLACDLVVRRRVQYERPVDGNPAAAETSGITSNIVVSRFLSAADCRTEHLTSCSPTNQGTAPSPSRLATKEPVTPKIEIIFDLCCRIVAVLRERPCAAASQHDLKDQLLPQDGENRHRDFAAARQKLVRASIVTVEQILCIDEKGKPQGTQSCLRLKPEHVVNERGGRQLSGTSGAIAATLPDDHDAEEEFAPFQASGFGSNALGTDYNGECPRNNLSCESKPASIALESVLSRDTSLMRSSYELLSKLGTDGLSYVDIQRSFHPFVDTRLAKMVYRSLKSGTAGIKEELKYFGRTRRLTLVLESAAHAGRAFSEGKPTLTLPLQHPSSSKVTDPVAQEGAGDCSDESVIPGKPGPISKVKNGHLKLSDFLLDEDVGYIPTPLPGLSSLALRRVQIVDRILQRYRVVRIDKVGRAIGVLEGKDYFQVDRRVVDRLLDCLLHDGKARKISLSSVTASDDGPAEAILGGNETTDDGVRKSSMDVTDVLFICSPEFDESVGDIPKRVTAAHARLLADLPQMKAPKQPEYYHATHSKSIAGTVLNDATFVSVACRKGERSEKKADSAVAELKLCLARLTAVEFGWIRAVLPRARLLHKLFVRHSMEQVPRQQKCNPSGIGVVSENEVVGHMKLIEFAQVVGIYSNFADAERSVNEDTIFSLSRHVQNEILSSPQGKDQRALLTSLLSRLGLLSRCSGSKLWRVLGSVTPRDFGRGVPPGLDSKPIVFSDEGSIDKFWTLLEGYKNLRGKGRGADTGMSSSKLGEEKARVSEPDALRHTEAASVGQAVEEVYDERWWVSNEPEVLSVDDQVTVECSLQSKIVALPSKPRKGSRRGQTFEKLGWFSEEEETQLFLQVSRQLSSSVSFERVVRHLRYRFANPFLPEARSQLLTTKASRAPKVQAHFGGRGKRRRRHVEPRASSRIPLRSSSRGKRGKLDDDDRLERDVRLLVMVSELRALVESQVLLQVRELDSSAPWHLRGLFCDEESWPESDVWQLWADVADAVGVGVSACWNRFKQLCEYSEVRLHFEESVVALGKHDLYTVDTGQREPLSEWDDPDYVGQGDHRLSDSSSLFRVALERRAAQEGVSRTQSSVDDEALDMPLVAKSKLPSKAAASSDKHGLAGALSGFDDDDEQASIVSPSVGDDQAHVDISSRKEQSVVSNKTEEACVLAILSKKAVTNDVLSLELDDCDCESGGFDAVNDSVRFAICTQTLMMVLAEPSTSFTLRRAVHLLKRFPLHLLTSTRDALISSTIIARGGASSESGRMFSIRLVSDLSSPHEREVWKGLSALRELELRLTLSGQGSDSFDFFAPAISRHELLATLQCTFAHRRHSLFNANLTLMPSAPGSHESESSVAGDAEPPIQHGVEGAALLQCSYVSDREERSNDTQSIVVVESRPDTTEKERLQTVSSLMQKRFRNASDVDAILKGILEVIKTNTKREGVSVQGLLGHTECSSFSSSIVVCGLALMVRERVVARVVVPLSCHGEKRDVAEVLYVPYQLACICPHAMDLDSTQRRLHASERPLTPWTRMNGSFDNALCHLVQTRILAALKLAPGTDEKKLIALLRPLKVPDQTVRDTLWALTRREIVTHVYRRSGGDLCSLLSSPERIVPTHTLDQCVLHFVDGLHAVGLSCEYTVSYWLRSNFQTKLLDAAEVVSECEASPGLLLK